MKQAAASPVEDAVAKPALPAARTRSSRLMWRVGLAMALTLLAGFGGASWQERRQAINHQLARDTLIARVLEDHLTRSIETVALALASLGDSAPEAGDHRGVPNAAALAQALTGLPQLRSVAVLDLQGHIVASTYPSEPGTQIDLRRLGRLPSADHDTLGPFVAGRSLAALASDRAPPPVPDGVGFVPMIRRLPVPGSDRLLVALINPDSWSGYMRLTLDDPSSRATLTAYDGTVIVDTGTLAPNASLAAHPVYREQLPSVEHASYVGHGIDSGTQTVAHRVSRTRPLVVLVERDLASTLASWRENLPWRAGAGVLIALAIMLSSLIASRSLRGRELARHRLDQALADVVRSERELNVIVRSVQELLFRTDAHGRLTFVNAHWAAATGQPAPAVLDTPFESIVDAADRAAVRALFDTLAGPAPREATVTLWAARRHARRVHVVVVPLRDTADAADPSASGAPISGFAGSAVDITEQEEAQARLSEQLALSALLQDASPLPTSLIDTHGCYVSVNRAWEEFMRRPRDEVIGRPAAMNFSDAEAAKHEAQDRELLRRGGSTRYEASRIAPQGDRRELLIDKVAVMGRDGKPMGVLSTFMDVTRMHEAARVIQEARDAAEEASRAKSEFIANISHELRTPLQSIIGFSELGTVFGREDRRLGPMFDDILQSGQRMLALVNDLLDVSKIDSAVGTIHLERTDIRPLVREVARELAPLFARRQLQLDAKLPNSPLVAKVDPLRFQQVIRNIVANAIKFAPAGSVITMSGWLGDDGGARVAVRDHGPGIPPAELDKIFGAFVQSSTTKNGSGGTGLGLAICRKIIEAHAGSITAENAEGGGSRFTVALPTRFVGETLPAELQPA